MKYNSGVVCGNKGDHVDMMYVPHLASTDELHPILSRGGENID